MITALRGYSGFALNILETAGAGKHCLGNGGKLKPRLALGYTRLNLFDFVTHFDSSVELHC